MCNCMRERERERERESERYNSSWKCVNNKKIKINVIL